MQIQRERNRQRVAVAAIFGFAVVSTAFAQKAPELGYVFPPAVQAGTESRVQLGGYDFTPDMQFFVHDDRVTLSPLSEPGEFIIPKPPYWFGEKSRLTAFPIPREIPARIHVPSGVPRGLVRWQVANANGSSSTAVFYVSDGREVVEDRYREEPQSLEPLPIGVSGRLEKIAEVDRYDITAAHDGPMTVELFARRLGADFNGVIEVRDSHGQLIDDTADTQGLDTELTFAATAGAQYAISLHDVDFRGHSSFVYRLAITEGPRVIAMIPAAAQRGDDLEVTFVGYGVERPGAVLESTRRVIRFPTDPQLPFFRYELKTDHGAAVTVEIPLRDFPELAADEEPLGPQDLLADPKMTAQIDGTCAVTAELGHTGEEAFEWQAVQGETWDITAQSRAIGTHLDLSLSILDAEGKELASNDDRPGTPDPGLSFTAPADGTFTCVVRDLSSLDLCLSSVYRLVFERRKSGFRLSVPQQINVPIAGQASLTVTATRTGGHGEDIGIEVEGLPEGVTVPPDLKISGDKTELAIPLKAAADVAALASLIRVVGTSAVGDETISRVASCAATGNLCPDDPTEARVSQVLLAITLPPKFSVELTDRNRQRAVHRGTTYPAPFVIKRDEGFEGAVMLQMAARQGRHRQGIYGPVVTVPAEAGEALYPCFMPEWLETDRTTRMVVLGVAKQADPQGNLRYVTKPADARITMILEGALLKVSHGVQELTVAGGDEFKIPIQLSRSAKLPTPVTVILEVPDELSGLVQSDPETLEIPAGGNHAVMTVRTSRDLRVKGRWTLRVKASTRLDQLWPVVSQCDVPVEFVSAPDSPGSAANSQN